MKICHFLHTACSTSMLVSGDNRVVIQLSKYFVDSLGIVCYQAYLNGTGSELSRVFADSFHYSSDNLQSFHDFLRDNSIDVIVFNYATAEMIPHIVEVCKIAHGLNIRVVYLFHFMPGHEGYSYGSFEEVLYSFKERKSIVDKTKKWLISSTQPVSAWAIHKLLKGKYAPAYMHCDKIVVFSEPYINRYLQIVGGSDRNKFAVISNPMSFPELLTKNELKSKRKEVIYVGRLIEPQKRVSLALKIWKLVEDNPALNDWEFRIIGWGNGEDFLRWLVKKYNLQRVRFEGQQNPIPYYNSASIMISTSSNEGCPMVLMEAMPMGCCCLVFDTYDAVHDFIEDGKNGYIVKNNDLKGYYQRLEELMMNEDKRIEMGTNAIESSQRFSMEKVAAKWKSLFSSLCG